jgi:hypothetical protein
MYGDVPMPKVRVRDLTLAQIIKLAEKHNKSCGTCPLFKTPLHCFNFCDASDKQRQKLKASIRGIVELDEDSIIKEED